MSRSKREKQRKTRCGTVRKIVFILLILLLLLIVLFFQNIWKKEKNIEGKVYDRYLASSTNVVEVFRLTEVDSESESGEIRKVLEKEKDLPRGMVVQTKNTCVEFQDKTYQFIMVKGKEYYVEKDHLVTRIEECVQEKHIYIRNATTIYKNMDLYEIIGLARKGEELKVIGLDKISEEGDVNCYKVQLADDQIGYIYGKYTSFTPEEALKNYQADVYDPIHSKVANSYGGGEASKLDFYPYEKPSFSANQMPESVYALYLNCGSNIINNIDAYIEFAKTTKINTFVVNIKDNESPAFPAKIFQELSPTNYVHAINSYDSYKNAIMKLKEAGFYVVGRITTFKDSYYVTDHPENAILDKRTNQPYLHNGSYWPSAYNRNVWYYTLALAKEAVEEFGFQEINFDYVRFPDRMSQIDNEIDLKNIYEEDKTEAIQRFVQYATDVLHEFDVYVSVDVFGETTNGTYTTAYGQYWPAISNIVDVISGMPYPDHFSNGYYGIHQPWNHPYQLMKYWSSYAMDRQKEVPSPAKVRTWIQAYDVMKYVDPNGLIYDAKAVEDEIRGLYESGANGGYITWLSNSSLEKYKTQASAFQIDYVKEYHSE